MTLYFITGNKNKFKEAKDILPNIKQINLDLPEIQHINPKKIIEDKLKHAIKTRKGEFFCEDVSLNIKCLKDFPGPLIKWFLESLGVDGIFNLVSKYKNKYATAIAIIGYTNGKKIVFFQGVANGKISNPKGKRDFGFDPIFTPNKSKKTFGQMTLSEKQKFSHRKKALIKFKRYLDVKNHNS